MAILPVKIKKTAQKQRFFYYYCIEQGNSVYIEKRTNKDIWRNLFQFPLIESDYDLSESEFLNNNSIPFIYKCKANVKSVSARKKHILSHQIIFARLIYIEIGNSDVLPENFIKINKKDISTFAVPKLLEEFMSDLNFI